MLTTDDVLAAGKAAAALLALAGLVGGSWRWIVTPTRRAAAAARRGLDRAAAAVEIVERELSPNGGTSLRDMVTRIDLRQIATEARVRSTLATLRIAVWESDAAGACVYASRPLLRLAGRSAEEITGNGWVSMVDPNQQERVYADWRAAVDQGREYEATYTLVRGDGSTIEVHAEAYTIRNGDGRLLGYVGALYAIPRADG